MKSREAGSVQRTSSAGIPPVNRLANFFVLNKLSLIGGRQTFFYFLRKPFIVVDQPLHGFHHQRFAIAALFAGQPGELGFQWGFSPLSWLQLRYGEFECEQPWLLLLPPPLVTPATPSRATLAFVCSAFLEKQFMRKLTLLISCFAVATGVLLAEKSRAPKIDPARIKGTVKYLSSDELEGRGTGQKGGDSAADYIAEQFKATGLKPAGDNGTYFQNVPMVGVQRFPRQPSRWFQPKDHLSS